MMTPYPEISMNSAESLLEKWKSFSTNPERGREILATLGGEPQG